ncbi:MAG: LCP family protein [Clostridia bacterium]|nr:LCP family protein [Clostridia bacterium]
MSLKRHSKKKILKVLATALIVVLVMSVVLLCLYMWEKKQGEYPDRGTGLDNTLEYNGEEYTLRKGIETFLVLGLDKFEDAVDNSAYTNDQQADFVMLFVIDNNNKSCTLLHINRDTMLDMNILGVAGEKVGSVKQQLALAHTYGSGDQVSCRNTADAVSKLLLNAKINNYASVTMDAVPLYNDLVGGVEVTVLDDFTGIDDTLVKGETITLNGEQALKYVQSRKGVADSSNESRMARQKQYLESLNNKTRECINSNDKFVFDACVKMSDYLVSNCTVNQLQNLFNKISQYEFCGIRYLEGESVAGDRFMEFYPSEESVKSQVVSLFYTVK